MMTFLAILLGIGLVLALKQVRDQRAAIRGLLQAIRTKQPLLREDVPGLVSKNWDQLCAETNELMTEVSRLQQLRSNQLTQLEATLGSLQEAVLIVDHENHILLANKALEAIFPRATNIMHQRLERVLHSVSFLNYVEAVRRGDASSQHEMEFAEGSSSVWVEVTGTIIPALNNQRGAWALFVLHDITKQKKLEAIRKDFVANVSHELRTPLSVIKGYAETLVDGHHDMPVSDRDRFLHTIQRHAERLNSLLEDLLALSRLESINPGLRREVVSLPALMVAVVDDYRARPAAETYALSFAIDTSVGELLLDPLKITQVLENLLDNALKYTPKGSRIELSARVKESEVIVCVRDNGPGIPAEDLPHIFERFYRVDKGRSREKGGTGLGLSIVKHIIQLHGARVWVESTQGQGTAFYFSLPLRVHS